LTRPIELEALGLYRVIIRESQRAVGWGTENGTEGTEGVFYDKNA
jgi:hypothetical protein